MYISQETPEQTDRRLQQVLTEACMVWLDDPYAFREYPASTVPLHEVNEALALVRDEEVWSVLAPADDPTLERFAVFSFHFKDGADNSGFVGWLATRLKRELGTGVFVVCGQNSGRGGIFDYWGVPLALAEPSRKLLELWSERRDLS